MHNKHSYHLVNPSPWPISVSAALLGLTIGGVLFFHSFINGIYLIYFSFLVVAILAFWWRDVSREVKKSNTIKRFGLLPLITVLQSPEQYQITLPVMFQALSGLFFLSFILLYFKKDIRRFLDVCFWKLYSYKLFKKMVFYYLYLVLGIKGLCDLDYSIISYILFFPTSFYVYTVLVTGESTWDAPLYIGAYYMSLGVSLIVWDLLASRFTTFLFSNPSHKLCEDFWRQFKSLDNGITNPIVLSGIFLPAGKLSAHGQAAFIAGGFTLITGLGIATVNSVASVKAAQAQAAGQAQAAQAQAQAAEAKYAYKTYKCKYDYKKKKMEYENSSWFTRLRNKKSNSHDEKKS